MKTSYLKHWDKEGTCYNQTITITEKTDLFIKTVNDKIKLTLDTISQKSVLSNEDLKLKTYLKPLQKGKNYTTHTMRNFVFSGILGVKIKDRNTIINIK